MLWNYDFIVKSPQIPPTLRDSWECQLRRETGKASPSQAWSAKPSTSRITGLKNKKTKNSAKLFWNLEDNKVGILFYARRGKSQIRFSTSPTKLIMMLGWFERLSFNIFLQSLVGPWYGRRQCACWALHAPCQGPCQPPDNLQVLIDWYV